MPRLSRLLRVSIGLACIGLATGTSLAQAPVAIPPSPLGGISPLPARDAMVVRSQLVPVGTGSISGTITAADTGRPLGSVRVSLTGSSGAPAATGATSGATLLPLNRTELTDVRGQFVFDHLPPGQFVLTANRSQFLAGAYGARTPGRPGATIRLGEAEHLDITLALARSAVISGTIRGEDGEPTSNAQVQIFRYTFVNGVRRLTMAGGA